MRRPALPDLAGALLLTALVALVYAPVRQHGFIDIDDPQLVALHPAHRAPLSWGAVTEAFRSSYLMNWIPLTSLSLQLDVRLWGIDAGRTLSMNAALHALGTLLLWRALVCLTGRRGAALFAAGVFAAHPLHVESVAWASSRKDVLAGVFFGLTLMAYARHARAPSARGHALVALPFALGLLSKPVLVTLPLLLLVLDAWPLGRIRTADGRLDAARALRAAAEKLPLLGLSLLATGLTVWAQQAGGAMRFLGDLSPAARVSQALLSVVAYLRDAFWPVGLAMPYPHPGEDVSRVGAAAAAAGLAAVSALAWQQRRARPWLGAGWLWFLVLLLPVLGLVPMGYAARADRYTYLPLTGLAVAVAWSVPAAWLRHPAGRTAVAAAAAAVLLALAGVAHRQVGHWQDTERLMGHTLRVTRDNSVAHLVLARFHARARDVERAGPHFEAVLRLEREAVRPVFEWAHLLDRSGRADEALALYREGVARDPGYGLGREALAWALERGGRLEEALEHWRHGRPEAVQALQARARVASRLGRHAEALAARRRLAELHPDEPAPAAALAFALATQADPALRDPEAALARIAPFAARHPEDPRVLDAWAAALAATGRTQQAAQVAERALQTAGEDQASALRERLARYRQGRAYIDRR